MEGGQRETTDYRLLTTDCLDEIHPPDGTSSGLYLSLLESFRSANSDSPIRWWGNRTCIRSRLIAGNKTPKLNTISTAPNLKLHSLYSPLRKPAWRPAKLMADSLIESAVILSPNLIENHGCPGSPQREVFRCHTRTPKISRHLFVVGIPLPVDFRDAGRQSGQDKMPTMPSVIIRTWSTGCIQSGTVPYCS